MEKRFSFLLLLITFAVNMKAQNTSPYWSLTGNSNATSSSKLGTTTYTALNLNTNNVPRIYIAPNGFIGIGTTNPTTQLHVEGQTLLNIFVNTVAPGLQSGSGLISYVKGMPTAAGQRLGYFLTGSQGGGTNAYNATGMVGYADGAWTDASRPAYITFETTKSGTKARSEAMRIGSDGHVGIGISDPGARLVVVDSSTTAIYAESVSDVTAVYAKSKSYAIWGDGFYGVYGTGTNTGVEGNGNTCGVSGIGVNTGVKGQGQKYGVYGFCTQGSGIGIYGQVAEASSYGGVFSSSQYIGLFASTSNASSYAAYFSGNVFTSGTYTASDRRLKKNIADFSDASTIINKLKPKMYEFQTEGKAAGLNLPKGLHYGLIAQDLESILPNLVKETPLIGLHVEDAAGKNHSPESLVSNGTFKAVNYIELLPIVIKGMQEQDAEKEKLKEEVQVLRSSVEELLADLQALKSQIFANASGSLSSVTLEVPVPNPANGSTNIRYNIPAGTTSARLVVVSMLGQVLKEVKLTGGAGRLALLFQIWLPAVIPVRYG